MKITERYKINKGAKVGDNCICPSCGTNFKKTSYQQVFCKSQMGTKCKDKYWNTVVPEKRCNTTRISPANASYYERVIEPKQRESIFYDDDQSWDAHKDSF